MSCSKSAIRIALLLIASVAVGSSVAAAAPTYKIVANPALRLASIDRDDLARIFLRKDRRWHDGTPVRPVDLVSSSETREDFTNDVLSRTVNAVRSYWQQRIFSGRDVPPPEFESEAEVVRYVQQVKGAIGYVSMEAAVGDAQVVRVR